MISQLCNVFFASLNSSIFFILLLFFKRNILKYIGARWYYYLWFTLFIPWISIVLPLDYSLENFFRINIASLARSIDSLIFNFIIKFNFSPVKLLSYIWFSGMLLALFYTLCCHIQFTLELKKKSNPLSLNQQKMVMHFLKNKKLIPLSRIYLTPLLSSPMIFHIIKSKIYLPINFFNHFTKSEKNYVLHHECIHYQRCDLLTNAAMIILLCMNWFNPLLLFSYRYFRGAQELSCDALVSQQLSVFEIKAYGYALLKTAVNKPSQSSISCSWNTGSQLKERCETLKLHVSNPIKNLIGVMLIAISAGIAMASTSLEKHLLIEDFKISNFSNKKFNVIANYKCADTVTEIEKNSVTVISQTKIQHICSKSPWNCAIVFYSSNNCSDQPVATVHFDLRGAIKAINVGANYNISGKDYNLLFYGRSKT